MEGVVAKRTLKRSYYANNNILIDEENNEKSKSSNKKETVKERILFKLAIQLITTIAIFVFVVLIKVMNIQVVLNADITKQIKNEFKKNWEIKEVLTTIKESGTAIYAYIEPIIPEQVEDLLKDGVNKIKNFVTNIDKKEVEIYEETNTSESNNKEKEVEESNGMGTSVEEEKTITAMSSLSYEETIADKIKNTGITFKKPLVGTITSNFGTREEIFEGIDSYHTGIDIAAKTGTKVVSSTDGKVTVATYNKYNGNYVEVTNGKVVTKYCHLSKISVKKGATIKAGAKIGEVGSTGYSTGPHLHFEIVYDGTKIDPRLVVDL